MSDDVPITLLLTTRCAFGQGLERFGLELPVLLQQDLHLAFRFIQLLAAGGGELHAFFEKYQRFFERYFAFFQLLNNLVQTLKTLFKFGQAV